MAAISVMTMVDSPQHLAEAYESLNRQSMSEWEWLVVPLRRVDLPTSLGGDKRVRVLEPSGFVASQGETGCKSFAMEEATASHVMELDQHDFLHPKTLAKSVDAVGSTEADLLYTDFVNVPIDEASPVVGYAKEYGWETFNLRLDGVTHRAVRAFDADPSSLHQASYSPSVGLIWRRGAFLDLDGPDPSLGNAGTFDLVCRAYLGGLAFHHIEGCVVFTRQHAYRYRETSLESSISEAYAHSIVVAWGRSQGMDMLDLGAARNPTPGFTSVDLRDAEINCDIRFGLPFEDGSVACVRAFDFLEHMSHCPDSTCVHGADGGPRCAVGLMNELYRVLAPGGWLISRTPSTDGRGAFQDPTHVSFWNPNSFWYYTRRDQARFVTGIECRFQAARLKQVYPTPWHEENLILYVDADLVALKGQRQPGICEI